MPLKNLSEWLTQLKEREGLSDQAIAKKLRSSQGTIRALRLGERNYVRSDELVEAIARYRNLSIEQTRAWIYGKEPKPPNIDWIVNGGIAVSSLLEIRELIDETLRKLGHLSIDEWDKKPHIINQTNRDASMKGNINRLIWACLARAGFAVDTREGREQAIASFLNACSFDDESEFAEEERRNIERLLRGEDIGEAIEPVMGNLSYALTEIARSRYSTEHLRQLEAAPTAYNGGCDDNGLCAPNSNHLV